MSVLVRGVVTICSSMLLTSDFNMHESTVLWFLDVLWPVILALPQVLNLKIVYVLKFQKVAFVPRKNGRKHHCFENECEVVGKNIFSLRRRKQVVGIKSMVASISNLKTFVVSHFLLG